jgi:multimeric flavodoxin WrbA
MKILIINGNDGDPVLDDYIHEYTEFLKQKGMTVKAHELRNAMIKQCVECCACMVKTPGICALKDGQQTILSDYLTADAVVIFTTLRAGFMNSLTKRFLDRLFPLELPFIDFKNGKMHHKLRYVKYPKMGFVFKPEAGTDTEDIELNNTYAQHVGEYYSELLFANTTETEIQELANETISI